VKGPLDDVPRETWYPVIPEEVLAAQVKETT
jgi:hypothetical protein